MAERHSEGVKSTAAIAGHPIHPMLIAFPIAFLVGALVTDLVYWGTADLFWARASYWLILAGLVMGSLAAITGLIDFLTISRAREHGIGWVHFIGNVVILIIALINLVIRWADPPAAIIPWGVGLSVLTNLLLAVTGWYGGELTYRHKIGVVGHESQEEQPSRVPAATRESQA
jgi:uncharacterized membrane protein